MTKPKFDIGESVIIDKTPKLAMVLGAEFIPNTWFYSVRIFVGVSPAQREEIILVPENLLTRAFQNDQ